MPRDFDSSITVYVGHFRKGVARLKDYAFDPEDRLLKKNILASLLDAISRTTSNPSDGNRERFTGLVAHFGDWSNHSRISAPHMAYFLRNLRSPAYEPVRAFITETIRKNSHGGFVTLAEDPEFEDVRKLWPVASEQKLLNQLSLTSFTHLSLFYQYRNSLVHELREPGYGMEFHENHDEPFYHGMTTIGDDASSGERTLELVYPLNFYFQLTESVISNVERYLRKNMIDPYKCYRFGSSWVGELNQ